MKNEINVGNILRGEDSMHVCPPLIFNWINVAYFLHPYWNLSDMQKWFMCHVVYLLISHWRQKEIHDKTIPLIPPRLAIPLNILLLVLLFLLVLYRIYGDKLELFHSSNYRYIHIQYTYIYRTAISILHPQCHFANINCLNRILKWQNVINVI